MQLLRDLWGAQKGERNGNAMKRVAEKCVDYFGKTRNEKSTAEIMQTRTVGSSHFKDSIYRYTAPILTQLYGGIGSILMLHRVTNGTPGTRVESLKRLLEISPDFLERTIQYLRDNHYAFLSLDDVYDILLNQRKIKKFVVITFDDGYRDIYQNAYPLLKTMGVPFTLYLSTGMPDKTIIPWEYLLEDLLCRQNHISFELDGVLYDYPLSTMSERECAFWALQPLFERASQKDLKRLTALLFEEEILKQKIEELLISWDELKEMSQHPLVTIGAHTVNHQKLTLLSRKEAKNEMMTSKHIIESKLDKDVRHFAYPYGTAEHAGKREFKLAKQCGFYTATTTRMANIFPKHRQGLTCLPRLSFTSLRELEMGLSGTISAFRHRGRRVIMD